MAGVPNLGDASPWGDSRGTKAVITWVHLYQWGDANGVRGDGRAKRLETPALWPMPLPLCNFCYRLPPPHPPKILTFWAINDIFSEIFGTSHDFHNSAEKFSKKI